MTNREFARNIRDRLPFLGSLVVFIFAIVFLVYLYSYSFLLGVVATPFVLGLGMWGILLVNNLYRYWKP